MPRKQIQGQKSGLFFAKVIERNASGDSDVQRFFLAEHGDGDDGISLAQDFFTNTFDFVADNESAGELGLEGGEVFGVRPGF